MCYSPIRLRTNKKSFNPKTDKLYNSFPCGKCGECRTQKQDSWEIRSYYEWRRCSQNNGITLFSTFTYDNDSLPYILLDDLFVPVFSKTHVRAFFDSFRFQLERYFGTTYNFRYFITSEYGGKTHRPHYHATLHFDNFPENKLNMLKHVIRISWKYGFVDFGKINGGIVQDVRAIKYVAKYVTKDLDFYDDTLNEYLVECKTLDKERYNIIKNEICPFHLQSKYYGLSALENVSKELAERGFITMPNYKTGVFELKKLPLYLERHLFYTLDQYNSYQLTPYGCDVRKQREKELSINLERSINDVFNNLDKILNDESLLYVNNVLGTGYNCTESIKNQFIRFRFVHSTFAPLVDYVINLRDTVFVDDVQLFEEVQSMSYAQRYNYTLRCYPQSVLDPLYYPDFLKLESRMFNGLNDYLECESLYSLYVALKCALGKQQNRQFAKDYQQYSKLKKHGYQQQSLSA